jgi:hypothetical protein
MGVYHDMANDAGYSFGTEENEQLAMLLMQEEYEAHQRFIEERQWEEEMERQREILFRKFK